MRFINSIEVGDIMLLGILISHRTIINYCSTIFDLRRKIYYFIIIIIIDSGKAKQYA